MAIDLNKERMKRSTLAKDWTPQACIEDIARRFSAEEYDYLKDSDAVVMVFSKRYDDGSSAEIIIQAGTQTGNEAIGILTCGVRILTEEQ